MIPACDAWAEIRRAIAAHPQKGSFLDVGGRDGRHAALAEGFRDYTILDLEPPQTLFAWDYPPRPVDYWRFTHAGLTAACSAVSLAYLFEQYGGLRTELAAYDAALRLEDLRGSGLLVRAGIVRRRLVKRKVLHIGRKP